MRRYELRSSSTRRGKWSKPHLHAVIFGCSKATRFETGSGIHIWSCHASIRVRKMRADGHPSPVVISLTSVSQFYTTRYLISRSQRRPLEGANTAKRLLHLHRAGPEIAAWWDAGRGEHNAPGRTDAGTMCCSRAPPPKAELCTFVDQSAN